MHQLKPHKIGLLVGSFVGLCHLVWSILVAFGWGQRLVDFIFDLHFIQPPYLVTEFVPSVAVMLVIEGIVAGYASGAVLAWLWNKLVAK